MTDRPRDAALWVAGAVAVAILLIPGCRRADQQAQTVDKPPAARKVMVEIDRMTGAPAIKLEQVINGKTVSLKSIYADAGIDLDVREDQSDLPRQDEVSLADLHAMMSAFRSVTPPEGVMRVHALVLTREREDPDTLGVMFDFGNDDADGRPREGFAIFADPHSTLPGGLNPELLLTMAHELGHCFNLHHPDWEGDAFRHGATVESYSQADSVRWSLSAHSKDHIRTDPSREVWPGLRNIGFGLVTATHLHRHAAAPNESFRVVDPQNFNERRPLGSITQAMRKVAQRDRSKFVAPDQHPLKLNVETPKTSYVTGEPIIITVGLHNSGTTNQSVFPLLDPKYRFLNVEIKAPGQDDFDAFQPVLIADARGVHLQTLAPHQSIHEEARIFFGADGWVFKEPGAYVIRADYPAPAIDGTMKEDGTRIQSVELTLTVNEPTTSSARRAKELILGPQEGLYLVLGGGDHLKGAAAKLKRVVQEEPTAPQAAAVRLTLGTAALNPTIDPNTGVQSQPRVDEAKKHLDAVRTSEQVPALANVKAQAELADALEGKGRTAEASRVRAQTVQKMQRQESAKEYIDEIRDPKKSSPKSARPPGGEIRK
jgi:hypothetical protein